MLSNTLFYVLIGISFLAVLYFYGRNLLSIVRGGKGNGPAIVTWFVYVVLDAIDLYAMSKSGVSPAGILMAVFLLVGSGSVFLLLLFYGKRGWTWLDVTCLTMALAGVVLAQVAHEDYTIALGLSLFAMMVGSVPLFAEAYACHQLFELHAWAVGLIACVTMLILAVATGGWSFANVALSIVATSIQTAVVAILGWKRLRVSK